MYQQATSSVLMGTSNLSTRQCVSCRLIVYWMFMTRTNIFSIIVTPLIIVAISLAGYQYYGSSTGGDDSDNEVNL